MKWVTVEKVHINLDRVNTLCWMGRQLWIWFDSEESATAYDDPFGENYLKVCDALGLTPAKEVPYGKK